MEEQTIPEFWDLVKGSAQLDVEAGLHCCAPSLLADVTRRHACAGHVLPTAACEAGHALEVADKAKLERYKPCGGRHVVPCSIELYGKVSSTFHELMCKLATLAAAKQSAAGVAPTPWLRRWKLQSSLLLAVQVGTALLKAGTCRAAGVQGQWLEDALGADSAPERWDDERSCAAV